MSESSNIQEKVQLTAGQLADLYRRTASVEKESKETREKLNAALVEIEALRGSSGGGDQKKLKDQVAKNEKVQTALQRMVASQSDKAIEVRREVARLEQTASEARQVAEARVVSLEDELRSAHKRHDDLEKCLTDVRRQQEELAKELQLVKQKMRDNPPRVVEVSESSNAGGAGPNVEILQVVERQLGSYDMQLAEQDLRFQVLEQTSYDGTLIWKITDYSRRKREAINGKSLSLYSQPFFTNRYGYKMCTRVYLNGDGMGKNTHLSLFFVVMKGEYDPMLQWPFEQKVTLMLLDQGPNRNHLSDTFRPDPSSSSFKQPTTDMNIASGCPLFAAHNVIENASATYVKDDTIFVKVKVDTEHLDHI